MDYTGGCADFTYFFCFQCKVSCCNVLFRNYSPYFSLGNIAKADRRREEKEASRAVKER